MKNKKIFSAVALMALACAFFVTCENPIMKKWWDETDIVTPPVDDDNTSDWAGDLTIVFDMNGSMSEAPEEQKVAQGGKIIKPSTVMAFVGETEAQDTTLPDMGFAGWYMQPEGTTEWDFTQPVTAGNAIDGVRTLYAKWDENPWEVNFYSEGVIIPSRTQKIADGAFAIEPTAGTNSDPGKGFAGWYIDETFSSRWDSNQPINRDMSLHAKWDTLNTTVYFYSNSTGQNPPEQKLAYGAKIIQPSVTNGEAAFAGWYTSPDFTGDPWDFNNSVTVTTMALYAKWNIRYYTVQFAPNGGTPPPPIQNLTYGVQVERPSAAMTHSDGKVFGGWYTDNNTFNYAWNFDHNIVTENLILYAKWGVPAFTVTFDTKGGTVGGEAMHPALQTQTVLSGGTVIPPPPLNKDGHGFAGWYTEDTGPNADTPAGVLWDVKTAIGSNQELFALWNTTYHTVTFNTVGGEPASFEQIVAEGAKVVEPAAISKEGHFFAGWYKTNPADDHAAIAWNFDTDTVSADMPLYAKWETNSYTVRFVPNYQGQGPEDQIVAHGGKVIAPSTAMVQTGKSVQGWYSNAAFLGTPWNFGTDTVQNDINLYAKWETAVYTVTFNTAGGSTVPPQSVVYRSKASLPDPQPAKGDDNFKGWYTGEEDTAPLYDFNTEVTANITLYARWVKHNPSMIWIPGGSFSMGGLTATDGGKPAHMVDVSGFYMFISEIPQMLFQHLTWWEEVLNKAPNIETYDTAGNVITDRWNEYDPGKSTYYTADGLVTPNNPLTDGYNPSSFKTGADGTASEIQFRPVESVTWYDAVYFCNLLTEFDNLSRPGTTKYEPAYIITNIVTGPTAPAGSKFPIISATVTLNPNVTANPDVVGYRLPTEAEWEYAARGGNGSPGGYRWAGSNTASAVAWYGDGGGITGNSGDMTHTIGAVSGMQPNGLGLYNMSGNVAEWCWDWFDSAYYNVSPASNPFGPASSPTGLRVRRGGSAHNMADNCRTQIRDKWGPEKQNWNVGFRVVRTGIE